MTNARADEAASTTRTMGRAPGAGVLVAVDGSPSAGQALRWAAREAQLRGCPLTIAHAYSWPGAGAPEAMGYVMDALEKDSVQILATAADDARAVAPEVPVSTESRVGPAVPVLVGLADGAQLAVVGSRGLGGFSGLLLGSVGTGLTANAPCPVAVVRGEREPAADDPVVVGVDGTAAADAVLAEAFRAAQRRGVGLVAVHCWQDPTTDLLVAQGRERPDFDRDSWQQAAARALDERLALAGQRFGSVHTEAVVDWGRPPAVLLDQAQSAQLLVVGTRGRGEISSLILGSTSRAMVQHAPCPVIVVRDAES